MDAATPDGMLPVPLTTLLPLIAVLVAVVLLLLKRSQSSASGKSAKGKGISLVVDASCQEDSSKPSVRLLYGTQTGTAERFAKQLGNELRRRYGDSTTVEVLDIENYKAAGRLHKETLVLFLMATYGDGEPTDNAADFYSWICGEADTVEAGDKEAFLKSVHYGVFGLGNKQYEHFNAVGKRINKVMGTLGATALVRRGDGDDDDCIDDDFDKWTAELFAALDAHPALLGTQASATGTAEPAPAAYDVEIIAGGAKTAALPFSSGSGTSAHDPYLATITEVRELHTRASDRSCVHVEIDISAAPKSLHYETGDHVAVYAQNSSKVVAQAAQLLGLPLETVFTLKTPTSGKGGDLDKPFAGPIKLGTALAYFADLLSSPHKEALLALASCASDPAQAARLRRLASSDGKAEANDYIYKQHRSLLEVMADFPSAKPSIGLFFGSVAPRLQPRFYSISSSSSRHPRSIHVTCAVVKETMPSGRVHEGVASTWLAGCKAGQQVAMFVRHSHFRLPADPAAPVIMVGPGTGLAPFRGFLQEREQLLSDKKALGPAELFFGCRSRAQDFIYQAELQAAEEAGAISRLHVAFSREGASKVYVQHLMEQQGAALWRLLQQPSCHVYICGDAKLMAKDVHRTLTQIVQQQGKMSGTAAEGWMKALSDSNRYLKDVW